jgi:2-polyprenyl-3-methyl-5-hydroxy-6-metoxy-1,4-benzoquinol methylase
MNARAIFRAWSRFVFLLSGQQAELQQAGIDAAKSDALALRLKLQANEVEFRREVERIEQVLIESIASKNAEIASIASRLEQSEIERIRDNDARSNDVARLGNQLLGLERAHHETWLRASDAYNSIFPNVPESTLVRVNRFENWVENQNQDDSARYAAFERFFYDSAVVEAGQAIYLQHLPQSSGDALDLGCGRGEWMSTLSNAGWRTKGVDSNRVQCNLAESRGLKVNCGDLFAELGATPSNSIDLVTALQVIEHMSPQSAVRLIADCFRVLRPGGTLIIETVNPLCMFAMAHFWLDETHVRPVVSYWVEFTAASVGFNDIQTLYQSLVPIEWRHVSHLANYFNYAVIARRP